MNCCGGEVDQNEIIKGYVNPHLNNAGIPQNYTNAISNGISSGNYQGEFGKLAQTGMINPLAQQLSGGNPFAQAMISNKLSSMAGVPQQGGAMGALGGAMGGLGGAMGGLGGMVNGISKKSPSGLVKSRLE